MKRRQTMTRLALARRLQAVALALAADKPVRVGRSSVRVPDRVMFEQEIETEKGEVELEFEVRWARQSGTSNARGKGRRTRTKRRNA